MIPPVPAELSLAGSSKQRRNEYIYSIRFPFSIFLFIRNDDACSVTMKPQAHAGVKLLNYPRPFNFYSLIFIDSLIYICHFKAAVEVFESRNKLLNKIK